MEEERDKFEEIMELVGYGRFQSRFNYMFNLTFLGLITAPYFNIFMALVVPEHWCKVPGIEKGNYTVEEWKNLTIPWKKDEDIGHYSKCSMYNITSHVVTDTDGLKEISCQHGWEYNNTWFTSTIPSDQGWFCEKEIYVTYVLTCSAIGELLGTVVFGYLGDKIGRRPVFLISLASLLIGRLACLYTLKIYIVFLITVFIGSFASFSIFQSPLIIAMEITRDDDRNMVNFLQSMGYNVVFCVMPLIYWAIAEWYSYMLATTAPIVIILLFQSYLIESPRWLASKGRNEECIKVLKTICEVNGSEFPEEVPKLLETCKLKPDKDKDKKETLLSSWILMKTTLYVSITWIATYIQYSLFFLNVGNIGGNPFMNYFWQAAAEVPGNVVAKYLCDVIGRRLTRFGTFILMAVGSLGIAFFIHDPNYETVVTVISAFVKFNASIITYVLALHTLELYPTSLRQTGLSIATISSGVISLCSPYIIYLGTSLDAKLPYIVCAFLGVAGALAVIPVPETLHKNLPETIKEAEDLGKGQSFWAIPKKQKTDIHLTTLS